MKQYRLQGAFWDGVRDSINSITILCSFNVIIFWICYSKNKVGIVYPIIISACFIWCICLSYKHYKNKLTENL